MLREYEFEWTGQIARFSVEGEFSYDNNDIGADGIVNTHELSSLEVSFFDPQGNLLKTYTDNHLDEGVNFNFDPSTGEILQEGVFDQSNGMNIGDGTRSDGLTFWTIPRPDVVPHLHVDDWQDEFGFPLGFSSHEDVGFFTRTTQELVDTGRVGEAYLPGIEGAPDRLDEFGQRIEVTRLNPIARDPGDPAFKPDFGTVDGDVIEVEGSDGLVFAGSGNDLVDASIASEGGNRIYLGRGNDIGLLGQGDRYDGGSGDDQFFALEGGDNIITGGRGADAFWITTGDFISTVAELTTADSYYTFAGNVSGNSDLRLLSDKATAIGFDGLDTNSFLQFEAVDTGGAVIPLISATLRLEHNEANLELARLIPATEDRPVNVSTYALEDGAEYDPVDGNDEDIDFGDNGANASATVSVGANGIYEWDVKELIEEPLFDGEDMVIALSGVFGNTDTDGRNSYAGFFPTDATDGLEPTLVLEMQTFNTITDFTSGEDVIGIAGFDIDFDDVELTDDGDNVFVGIDGINFALLEGVRADELSASDFVFA